jgi:hypothetical protein
MKIEESASESGFMSQRHGSADPDPHRNVMDSHHCYDCISAKIDNLNDMRYH